MPPQSTPEEEATMAIKASRVDVWMTVIDDRAGGAAEKLEALANAGADLEVVFAGARDKAFSSPARSRARRPRARRRRRASSAPRRFTASASRAPTSPAWARS